MPRRPKTNRVPCTRAGGEWTDAAFWGFLRSLLRAGTRKWPPIVRHAKLRCRRPYTGPNKRQRWEYQCAECGQWFKDEVKDKSQRLHVDHVIPAGSLRSLADLPGFVERLFCESDNLRVLCTPCHKIKTDSENTGRKLENETG